MSRLWALIFCVIALYFLSCSHCYIAQKPYVGLADSVNTRLEVHARNGDVYQTRNYRVENDTLYILDYSTALGSAGTKVPLNTIKYINVCEFNTKRGIREGQKFAFWFFMICAVLYMVAPKDGFTIGG